jgi:hypothetical protein
MSIESQIAPGPVAPEDPLGSRQLLPAFCVFEVVFGSWLIAGRYSSPTWWLALLCIRAFLEDNLSRVVAGDASCVSARMEGNLG